MDAAMVSSSTFLFQSSLASVPRLTSATVSTRLCSSSLASAWSRSQRRFRTQHTWRSSHGSKASASTIKCGAIKEIGESEFSSTVLESDRPVLVEFVATWCGPCRLIYPAMESLAQEYEDKLVIVKIDHDANPQLIEKYKVYGLPYFILFKNGQEVPGSRREGAITKAKIKEYIDGLLSTIPVA